MAGMGYNVHLSYCSDGYWAQLLERFKVDKPGALLLLDSFGHGKEAARALEAARQLPETLIIYRKFLQGDNQHRYLTPAQWVAEHQQFAGTRVYCSADNEPAFAASLPWLLEVAKAAKAANLRASLGGWSVGGYQISDIPQMDALLRYTAANAGRFVYDLHEYTRGSWTVDFMPHEHNPANWPLSIPRNTSLWLMGRFRHIISYCDTMGIKRPQIVIGEFGFDRVLAVETSVYGNVGGLNTLAGLFKSWGYENWEAYAAVQLQAAFHAIYKPYGVPVCFYQLCDHPENWKEFNAYFAPTFMDATRKGFDMTILPTQPAPTEYSVGEYVLRTTQSHINLRSSTGADIGDIVDSARVTVTGTELRDLLIGGRIYPSQPVRVGDTAGFVALLPSFTLEPYSAPPTDRYAELAARCRASAVKLRTEAAELDAIAKEAEAL